MSKKGLFGVSLYRGAIKKKTSQGKKKEDDKNVIYEQVEKVELESI